ncbi:hypothetical protein D8895_13130 [Streptococcus sp. BCA20]|nr:hypothetical protein D8895_13130 [Streptococcus sp. BCA20]
MNLNDLYAEIQTIENIQAITQLNVWTTDGLEKFATIHICMKHPKQQAETQQLIRQHLKMYGITKVTIQADESLNEHEECCIGGENEK